MTVDKILACIDGSPFADSVANHALWAAEKLGLPVELLRVLGRKDGDSSDLSGRIVMGARRRLLEELSRVDEERGKLQMQEARLDLDEVRERLVAGGVSAVTVSLRSGDLLEALGAREPSAALVIVGKRGEAAGYARQHLGSNLERILRSASKPVLVTGHAHRPIRRVLVAYDGRSGSQHAVDGLAGWPLLSDVEVVVVLAGSEGAEARQRLERAASKLGGDGRTVRTELLSGPAESAIPAAVQSGDVDLIVMGAYGHSPLRTLFLGSTTATILTSTTVSALVYR